MTATDQIKLADEQEENAREALLGFAAFHLPERLRVFFSTAEGREVFEHSVVFGNDIWDADKEPKYGRIVSRARAFLIALPRFRKLVDLHEFAHIACCESHYHMGQDEAAYARDIEDTYRIIEHEMSADVREECGELGFA